MSIIIDHDQMKASISNAHFQSQQFILLEKLAQTNLLTTLLTLNL